MPTTATDLIIIDPRNLSAEDAKRLGAMEQCYPNQNQYSPNEIYQLKNGEKIQLTHQMYVSPRKRNKKGLNYVFVEVDANKNPICLGEGGFGQVMKVAGVVRKGSHQFKPGVNCAMKILDREKDATREVNLSKGLPHLNARPLICTLKEKQPTRLAISPLEIVDFNHANSLESKIKEMPLPTEFIVDGAQSLYHVNKENKTYAEFQLKKTQLNIILGGLPVSNYLYRDNQEQKIEIRKTEDINKIYSTLQRTNLTYQSPHYIVPRYAFVLRKFNGKDIYKDILLQKNKVLNIDEIIQLSIDLLITLQKQIHNYGIVHRDIKPENIIFDRQTGELNIIDAGLADYNDKSPGPEGTPYYAAPEAISGLATEYCSDVYSLGILLGELFGKSSNPLEGTKYQSDLLMILKALREERDYSDLPRTNELAEGHANQIKSLITSMTRHTMRKRPSIVSAIDSLAQVQIERKQAQVDEKSRAKTKAAMLAAYDVRKAFMFFKNKWDANTSQIIEEVMDHALSAIDDDPVSIKTFISTLQMQSFRNETSKKDISKTLKNIIIKFENSKEALNKLLKEAKVKQSKEKNPIIVEKFNDLIEVITDILTKENKYSANIDNMVTLTLRFEEKINDVKNNLNAITNECFKLKKEEEKLEAEKAKLEQVKLEMEAEKNRKEQEEKKRGLNELKNRLGNALTNYCLEKNSCSSIFSKLFSSREINKKRINDLTNITNLIINSETTKDLEDGVKLKISQIQCGLFGNSKLRDNLKAALENKKEKPVQLKTARTLFL